MFVNFEDPRLAPALDHTTLDTMVEAFEADRGPECTTSIWRSTASLGRMPRSNSTWGRRFPGVVASPDRDMLLRGYFQDIVERDMRERVAARSSLPLRHLVQMLYESAGAEMSVRHAAAALGISVDTAGLYIDAAEIAYVAIGCPFFAWSARRRLARSRKFYPIDTGLRRVSTSVTGRDLGKQLECAVSLLLRRRFGRVSYWRGEGEVDFVVDGPRGPIPVQVSWQDATERARRAVDAFREAHPTAGEAVFVTAASFAAGVPELVAPDGAS